MILRLAIGAFDDFDCFTAYGGDTERLSDHLHFGLVVVFPIRPTKLQSKIFKLKFIDNTVSRPTKFRSVKK